MAQERDEWYQACVVGMESWVESRLEEEKKRRGVLSASQAYVRSSGRRETLKGNQSGRQEHKCPQCK